MISSSHSRFFAVAILFVITSCGLRAQDAPGVIIKGHPAHPTRILAKVKPVAQASAHSSVLATNGLRATRGFDLVPGLVLLDVDPAFPAMAAASAGATNSGIQAAELIRRIETLRASGLFEYVEPDYLMDADVTPTDSAFTNGTLWGLRNTGQSGGVAGVDVDAVRAWDLSTGSTNVIVGVIDSGIRYTHTDLAANMWRNPGEIAGNGVDDDGNGYIDDVHGINAITGSGNPMDDDGHGTHVAGTIGAAVNNGHAHVGVAWNVRIMALKFLPADSGGDTADAIECVNYAVAHGATILNNSWGGGPRSQALQDAIAAAQNQGVLFVASAGNDGTDNDASPHFPSSYDLDNVIAVAAIDRSGNRPSFSDYGARSVDLGAPGVSIYSTTSTSDTSYDTFQGTSMAAPHVSGVAVLIRARFPTISVADLRDRLLNTTVPTPLLVGITTTGGRVNAYQALTAAGDGQLEVTVSPVSGVTLYRGRATPIVVRVTDLTGITGATVTGTIGGGGGTLTFLDNGIAPDARANDSRYTATLNVPASGSQLTLAVNATASGKTAAHTDLSYVLQSPPANDNFADRLVLNGTNSTTTANNVGATLEPGEPILAGENGGASLWWSWTAPANTTVTLDTIGSSFDTLLGVFTGNAVGALTEIASNDDIDGPDQPSKVTFGATAGTVYQIVVDGWEGKSGSITLNLTTAIPPPNDRFADRLTLTGAPATASASLANATFEPGEPAVNQEFPRTGSIWWEWTAPSSGTAKLTHTGWTMSAVYTGTVLAELTRVPGRFSDDVLGYDTFPVTGGTTYQIAILETTNGPGQDTTLNLTIAPAPVNDMFANRISITGTSVTTTGTNVQATREADEAPIAEYTNGATVWWTWTAPSDGTAIVDTAGSNFNTFLAAYTGDTLSSLQLLVANNDATSGSVTSRIAFTAHAGATYQLVVDGPVTATGTITLNLALITPPANDQFTDRTAITGTDIEIAGTHVGATREPGELGYGDAVTVWWSWTAPKSGTATVRIPNGGLPVRIYTGSALNTLTPVIDSGTHLSGGFVFHASAGASYAIVVESGTYGPPGAFTMQVSLVDGPPNDMFADRTVLSGTSVAVAATTKQATIEKDEPSYGFGGGGGSSVWWMWTAPANGTVILDTESTSYSVPLAVYTGTALTALTQVSSSTGATGNYGHFVFLATAGTIYQITAVGYGGTTAEFTLHLDLLTPPDNDDFADRAAITGSSVQVATSNRGATRESNEPIHADTGGASLWWSWAAPITGTATITTQGSTADTLLAVYTGNTLTNLVTVGSNQEAEQWAGYSRVVFHASAGTTYQIAVDGRYGDMGDIALNVSVAIPPGNDNFANRTPITGSTVTASGTSVGATREDGEPNHGYYSLDGASVWWSWTAPVTGATVLTTTSGGFDYMVAVYTGSSFPTLTQVAAGLGAANVRVSFAAIAGTTYQIALEGVFGRTGGFGLTIATNSAPANDHFANRATLSGRTADVSGSNLGATREGNEPEIFGYYAADATVWWTWTAPANGAVILATEGGTNPPLFELFSGPALASLERRASHSHPLAGGGTGQVYNVVAGVAYSIVLASPNVGLAGDYRLVLEFVDAPANDAFADRGVLEGDTVSLPASNLGASRETGEPFVGGYTGVTSSVWWSWTAPSAGTVRIDIAATQFYPVVGVFTGTSLSSLSLVVNSARYDAGQHYVFHAEAGTTYQIVADSGDGPGGTFTLSLVREGGPPNDMFANRIELTGTSMEISATSVGATVENGEPSALISQGASIWWTWTAPRDGKAVIAIPQDFSPYTVRVFTGTSLAGLTGVSSRYANYGGSGSRLVIDAVSGTTYQIAVSGAEGEFMLDVDLVDPPGNDSFADRVVVEGTSVTLEGYNLAATAETGEPNISWQQAHASVWWSWTAPADGRAVVETSGTGYPFMAGVFSGAALNNLTAVSYEARPWTSDRPRALIWDAQGGTTYQIAIDGYWGAMGSINLRLSLVPRPSNDAFARGIDIPIDDPVVLGVNVAATVEPQEPYPDSSAASGSLWWTWTAPEVGPVAISTEGSDFDTILAVYTGDALENLTKVGENQDDPRGGTTSRVILVAAAGVTYHIAVDGYGADFGAVVLSVEKGELPVSEIIIPTGEILAGREVLLQSEATGSGPFAYEWLFNGTPIPGATGSSLSLASVQQFNAGNYSVRVGNEFGTNESAHFALNVTEPRPSNARLTNLSTRALDLTGDKVLIPGFVIEGPGNKRLLIRAVGPTLAVAPFNLGGTLPNPRLALKRFNGAGYDDLATNDDWGTNNNVAEIIDRTNELGAFGLADGSGDAALLIELAPGQYSVVTDDPAAQTGIAIVELYDADEPGSGSTSRLINISNRGYVGAGDNIMIPGFVVSSEGPKTLLIRVVGPTLGQPPYNVPGVLADPTLTIFRHDFVNNTDDEILTNDDWSSGPGATRTRDVAAQVSAFALPEGSKDAAFVVTLNPGVYTVHARGKDNTEGIALVEVYAVP